MKNCTPLWREAHFQVKMYKTPQLRTTFGSGDVDKVHAVVARSTFPSQNVQNTPVSDHFWKLRCRKSARRCGAKHISKSKCTKHTSVGPLLEVADVEKVHAVVARSTFPSQNVQSTPFSDHFWKFRCRKSARRCGAKHISKSKCTKHTILGPLLEVQMLKKCTPLWRGAHFQVKMYKTLGHSRTTFGSSDVEKVHAVVARQLHFQVHQMYRTLHHNYGPLLDSSDCRLKCTPLWREATLRSQNVQNTPVSDHFWRLRCRFASLHYTTLHHYDTTLQPQLHNYTTTTTTQLHNYTPLH